MLVYDDIPETDLDWVQRGDAAGPPRGSVVGGHTLDGHPLYVVKAVHDDTGFDVAGNHDLRNDFAEYEYYGIQRSSNWYFLVFVYRRYSSVQLKVKCDCNFRRSQHAAIEAVLLW